MTSGRLANTHPWLLMVAITLLTAGILSASVMITPAHADDGAVPNLQLSSNSSAHRLPGALGAHRS